MKIWLSFLMLISIFFYYSCKPEVQVNVKTTEPSESEIQHAAFLLWEERGRPANRDLEIWLAAKERLKHSLHLHPADAQRAKNAHLLPRTQRAAIAGVR